MRLLTCALVALVLAAGAACATVPPPPTPEPPPISFDDKMRWIIRLEDQRILQDPNPPAPIILVPATRTQPAIVAPPPPSDLIRLLGDREARVRRRAALAAGRVGLREAVDPLRPLLAADPEPDVRSMAAFALGLIGDAAARPALVTALADPDPIVQGRAAEALGMIADRSDAAAVSQMVQTHIKSGALASIQPDDLTHPLAPPVEAIRLGIYALVRLGSYDALAATVLDANGQPVSAWWPIAYALRRAGDARAVPALLTLLNTPGRYTAAFAAQGLGVLKATGGATALRQIVEPRAAPPAVVVQAMRSLAALGDAASAAVLTKIVADVETDATLRLEAMTALSQVASSESLDLLLDLVTDPLPAIRGLAMRSLARVDPDTFLVTLSGLDPDRDPAVRAAQAAALGSLPDGRGVPGLMELLGEKDHRVIPAVLAALVASRAPEAEKILIERVKTADFALRAAAANGLVQLKSTAAVPALVEAYRAATGDSTYVARGALLNALTELNPAAAQPLLEEALRDRDWAIRQRAAAVFRQRPGGESVEATIRPAPAGRPVTDAELGALINPQFSPHAYIETDRGTIELELAILDAPLTVANFIALGRKGFFDGIAIHRIVSDFVVQDGDPRGDGEGGPGYTIRDEINMRPYLRGTVGMALDWEDTGGSQFFITHSPQPHLDGRYTVFGHVVAGMEVVDRLIQGDVIRSVRIWDGITATR